MPTPPSPSTTSSGPSTPRPDLAVSVIVPVRDDPERLRACLTALARQTLPDEQFEVVVVDNASREPVTIDDPGVRVVREPRVGSYAARNRGLRVTTAPVVAFTDADCLPEPDWLERGLARLAGADVVAGAIEVFPRLTRRPRAVETYERLTAFPQQHFVERWGFGATANVIARRAVVDAVGPFDASLESGGDAEWGERVTAAGFRTVYADEVVVRHPARRTLRELSTKFRRITRGIDQLGRLRDSRPPLPVAVGRSLARPFLLLRDQRVPVRTRLAVIGVELAVTAFIVGETVRCRRQR